MYPREDERSELYGYWGSDRWIIRPAFGYAHGFHGGYAAVDQADGRPALVAKDGTIFPLEAICGGRKLFDDDLENFTGFGDCEWQPPAYAGVSTEVGGRREWGLIDLNLRYHPLPADVFGDVDSILACREHVVVRRRTERPGEHRWGLFNLAEGRLELPIEYSWIEPTSESLWVVAHSDDVAPEQRRYAYYDVRGKRLLPGRFTCARRFSDGLGAVYTGKWMVDEGQWNFVNEDLAPALDDSFDDAGPFSHGLAHVCQGDDLGYIDASGRMRLLLPHYETLTPFNRFGLALANRDESEWDIDIIDRTGRARVKGLETADFCDGDFPYYSVTIDGESHRISPDLKMID